jgi:hypothetical protein
MQNRCVTALVGVLLVTAIAEADESATAPRVRVTSPGAPSGRVVGRLAGLDADTLTLRVSGEPNELRLRRQAVTRVEISRQRGNRRKATAIGFVVGALAGALLGATTTSSDDWISPGVVATGAGVALGTAGALLGLATSHGEKWETSSPDGLHVTFAVPRGGGAGLRLALRF